jgi:hypothetical protein
MQRLIGSKKSIGDKAIYVAALKQEERYKAFLNDSRISIERSLTPSRVLARIIAERSLTLVDDPYNRYNDSPIFQGKDIRNLLI